MHNILKLKQGGQRNLRAKTQKHPESLTELKFRLKIAYSIIA